MGRTASLRHLLLAAAGLQSAHAQQTTEIAADRIDGNALPGFTCVGEPSAISAARGETCLPSRHYSGYIDASAAADGSKMLHYWFVEAEQVDPLAASTPVVMWLNGGPGSVALPVGSGARLAVLMLAGACDQMLVYGRILLRDGPAPRE